MKGTRQGNDEVRSMFTIARRMAYKYGTIGYFDPEDMAQIAMIKLLNRSGERPATIGWLYKTVRSAAADAARAVSRERAFASFGDDGLPDCVCEHADGIGSVYGYGRPEILDELEEQNDLIPQLVHMLKQLAAPLRVVLLLYANGHSYEQIATATGAKLGTVRSRLHYARIRAKAILRDCA
jgi:RNA polymerase sigma-70 factor (ECF subfamily)